MQPIKVPNEPSKTAKSISPCGPKKTSIEMANEKTNALPINPIADRILIIY